MIKGYVYLIINHINGRKYIGSKKGTPDKTRSYFGSGVALKHAINQYGIENFEKIIIQTFESIKLMMDAEEKYLLEVDAANNPEYYNMKNSYNGQMGYTPTTETINKWFQTNNGNWYWATHDFTEEHRNKMSLAKLGTKQSPETIAKRIRFGEDHHNYQVPMANDQKQKIGITKTLNSMSDGGKGYALNKKTGNYQARKQLKGKLIPIGTYSSAWVAHLFYLHACWEFFLTGDIKKWRAINTKARPQKNYVLEEINRRLMNAN